MWGSIYTARVRPGQTLYIRVPRGDMRYLVVYRDGLLVLGERLHSPFKKCVRRWCYYYIKTKAPMHSGTVEVSVHPFLGLF